jgi:hypothetical protein
MSAQCSAPGRARAFVFFMMKTRGIITRNSTPSIRKIITNATIAACRCTMLFSVGLIGCGHEQLGLKLDSQHLPFETVVIDSVERPMED